jgi:hypothetical protein
MEMTMYRSSPRRIVVLLFLTATLLISPLNAAPLFGPGDAAASTQSGSPSFLTALWERVSSLWTDAAPVTSSTPSVTEIIQAVPVAIESPLPLQTGSCIDPMGGRPPCIK